MKKQFNVFQFFSNFYIEYVDDGFKTLKRFFY